MPSYTINHDTTAEGHLQSQNLGSGSSWAEAYDGNGAATVTLDTAGDHRVGAYISASNKNVFVTYFTFDTSTIMDSEVVVAATLRLTAGAAGGADGDFLVEVYPYAYGTLATGDWLTTAQLAAIGVAGSKLGSDKGGAGTDFDITLTGAAAFVNKSGLTQFAVSSDMHRTQEARAADPDSYEDFETALSTDAQLLVTTVGFTSKVSHWPRERRANRSYIGW